MPNNSDNNPVVITAAARTPIGGFLGALQPRSAPQLGAVAIAEVLKRSGLNGEEVDEVLMGCVLPAGLGNAPARQAALGAGMPMSAGATTVNKMCGSGLKAAMLAHDAIRAGNATVMVAGGMESMSNAPYLIRGARGGLRIGHAKLEDHMFLDGLEDITYDGRLMGDFAEDVPSDRMRARFHGALDAYREGRRAGLVGRLQDLVESLWPRRPLYQFGLALGALVVGLVLGGRFVPAGADPVSTAPAEIRALRAEMQQELQAMHRSVSLSLLDHQSASERLRGVEWTARAEPDERVVAALLAAVQRDPSVNVRLAAIEALGPLVDRPAVGGELLRTLEGDAPPIVRVSAAELLLAGGVAGAGPAVERMLDGSDLDPAVQEHLRAIMRSSS